VGGGGGKQQKKGAGEGTSSGNGGIVAFWGTSLTGLWVPGRRGKREKERKTNGQEARGREEVGIIKYKHEMVIGTHELGCRGY